MAAVDTTISDVTVYTDRARITRRGKAHLTAGEQTLSIENVPTSMQDDSVRASGRGEGVRILGVETVRDYITEAPEEDLAALQKELETLQDQDAALVDAMSAEDARQDYLKNLRNSSSQTLPRGIAYGRAKMDDVTALSKYIEGELADSQSKKRDIAQQRRELARKIEVVQKKLQPRWVSKERRAINVIVEAAAGTDFDLEVTYSVLGASWSPLYDIRLIEDKVTLGYLANVQQQTGEDWPAVKLSLSTAQPAVSATIPELDPWFIDVYTPPVYRPMAARCRRRHAHRRTGAPIYGCRNHYGRNDESAHAGRATTARRDRHGNNRQHRRIGHLPRGPAHRNPLRRLAPQDDGHQPRSASCHRLRDRAKDRGRGLPAS